MADSPRPSRGDDPSADSRTGRWLTLALFGVGGLFFLGGLAIAVGVPGATLSGNGGGGGNGAAGGASGPAAAGATATPAPTATPRPTTSGPARSPSATARAQRTVVHRVNVGGPRIVAPGSAPDWAADRPGAPSRFLNSRAANTVVTNTSDPITLERGVPSSAPEAMFRSYRLERGSDRPRYEEMTWRFPVEPGRQYEVRIYVVEAYFIRGTPAPGDEKHADGDRRRTFGLAIENRTVLRNYEPLVEHGHDVGAMQSFTVTADDDTLSVRFRHEIANPTVSGIEVVATGQRAGA